MLPLSKKEQKLPLRVSVGTNAGAETSGQCLERSSSGGDAASQPVNEQSP